LQRLFAFTRSPIFAERAARMGGYEIRETGSVAFNL